ncbi:hypothetical protein [Marinilabilia salmonicolor]|uniref:hypothetical protein n=1 Tax=Marinilabilia salmonicolor TaxID=989 RepID=UPI000299D1EF|nr:hypothetical protein [Marinilabilia salmonicolor]
MQGFSSKSFKKSAPVVINSQNITVQKNIFRLNDFSYLKGAVACPFSGPADIGKPKWATFKALRNGRKFWLSRADRFKRTRLFSFFLGQCQKGQ